MAQVERNKRRYSCLFRRACKTKDISQLARAISKNKFKVNCSIDEYGDLPPLIYAILKGSYEVIRLLLDQGADPDVWDGWPLVQVLTDSTPNRNPDLVRLLLENGASPDVRDGRPLYEAVRADDIEAVHRLLITGADVDSELLAVGCEQESVALLRQLLSTGGRHEDYALERLVEGRDPKLVEMLLNTDTGPVRKAYEGPLLAAMVTDQLDLVHMLLDRSTDPTASIVFALRKALLIDEHAGNVVFVEALLRRASQLVPGDQRTAWLGQYARLCQAILENNAAQVATLLGSGDYARYVNVVDGCKYARPTYLAKRHQRDLLKEFVRAGAGLEDVFLDAAGGSGDPELLELCAQSPGFEPHLVRSADPARHNALHYACSGGNLQVIEILINKYHLDLEWPNAQGATPMLMLRDPELVRKLMAAFPETSLTAVSKDGQSGDDLLHSSFYHCELYVAWLEHGVESTEIHSIHICKDSTQDDFDEDDSSDDDDDNVEYKDCAVVRHLQKLFLIDDNYAKRIFENVLRMELSEFMELECPQRQEFEEELATMRGVRISQGTTRLSPKNLLDFVFFGPNEAARYSRNEVILQMYEDSGRDFRTTWPHYGFALNWQLRMGQVRYRRFELAEEQLSSALGSGMPRSMMHSVFGDLSNEDLKSYEPAEEPSS